MQIKISKTPSPARIMALYIKLEDEFCPLLPLKPYITFKVFRQLRNKLQPQPGGLAKINRFENTVPIILEHKNRMIVP
jgi:hypothetical protein